MRGFGAVLLAASILGGCATTPESIAAGDPLEPINRPVYRLDERFDKYVVIPAAGFYLFYMPTPLRVGLHNVLVNCDLPATFANDILQGKVSHAGATLGRFVLNATAGIGGLIDVATPAGLPYKAADFGQTLALYGVPEGPFLVLPVIGPDPTRDLFGDAVDLAMNPVVYLPPAAPVYARLSAAVALHMSRPFEDHARAIVLRRELEKGSVDPYVTMRSVYRQLREDEIGAAPPDEPLNGAK